MGRGSNYLYFSLILILILIGLIFFYLATFEPDYVKRYETLYVDNPLSSDFNQALSDFDERSVFYLLYNLEAYKLHNSPLSSETPKIEFQVDEEFYSAEINNGDIEVLKESLSEKDLVIKTSKEGAVKMALDKNYVEEAYKSGELELEFVEAKSLLFAKGYLKFYGQFSDNGFTANVLRIYTK
jgi:hypothetical protein